MAQMQTCEELWDLLSAFADGMVTRDEAGRVERHVAICADCARDLRFMQETAHVLAKTPEVVPPATLRDSILAATIYRPTWQQRIRAAARKLVPSTPLRAMTYAGSAAAILLVAYVTNASFVRAPQTATEWSGTNVASVPSFNPNPSPFFGLKSPALTRSDNAKTHPFSPSGIAPDSIGRPELDTNRTPASETPRIVEAAHRARDTQSPHARAESALLARADSAIRGISRRSAPRVAAVGRGLRVNPFSPSLQPERVEQPKDMFAEPSINMADMKIPMTAMNTNASPMRDTTAGSTAATTAAQPAERSRVKLASVTSTDFGGPGSIVTLADLRRQLRHQNNELSLAKHPELRLRNRRETLDVVRSSF